MSKFYHGYVLDDFNHEDLDNYNDLAKKFYHHLLLQRPFYLNIYVNMWYTLDLKLVSEMGLFKGENLIGVQGYTLGCKLLEINADSEKYDVQVRPMSEKSLKWSDCIDTGWTTYTDWTGVQTSIKRGLEFCVTPIMKNGCNNNNSEFNANPSTKFLYVYPVITTGDCSANNGNAIIPLIIGPIYINHLSSHEPIQSESSRDSTQETTSSCNYRAFDLPNGKYLIIKELWNALISGKIWDPALVMAQMFNRSILNNPTSFVGKSILDLSTGNGFVGLYLAAFLSTLQSGKSKTNIILTDMNYALELIHENLELNKHSLSHNKVTIDVEELKWGDFSKAKNLGIFDYVLASDVVYNPGHTKIYLGYKRRCLTEDEEILFFKKLGEKFQVSAVKGLDEKGKVNIYELKRFMITYYKRPYHK